MSEETFTLYLVTKYVLKRTFFNAFAYPSKWLPNLARCNIWVSFNRGLITPVLVVITWYYHYYIINIVIIIIVILVIILINPFISAVHVIQKKVNWTNKQPISVTQKTEKSRRTTETAVGKKRKKEKGGRRRW